MDTKDIIIIILLTLAVGAVVYGVVSSIMLNARIKAALARCQKLEEESDKLRMDNTFKSVQYSKDVMEFIRDFCVQVSVLKFRTFMDNHKPDLMTKTVLEGLIREICEFINIHLNYDIIETGYCFYTKSYIDDYIIETVVLTVKDLFDKAIVDLS